MLAQPTIEDGRVEVARVRLKLKGPVAYELGHNDIVQVLWMRADGSRGSYLGLLAVPHDPSDPYECVGGEA